MDCPHRIWKYTPRGCCRLWLTCKKCGKFSKASVVRGDPEYGDEMKMNKEGVAVLTSPKNKRR